MHLTSLAHSKEFFKVNETFFIWKSISIRTESYWNRPCKPIFAETRPIAISCVLQVFSNRQTNRRTDQQTDGPTNGQTYWLTKWPNNIVACRVARKLLKTTTKKNLRKLAKKLRKRRTKRKKPKLLQFLPRAKAALLVFNQHFWKVIAQSFNTQ